jgi:hypothetical protein
MVKKICKNCGYNFYPTKKYKDTPYCCTCRRNHKLCEICGKEIFVQARTCSKECAYELRKLSWLQTCGTTHNFCKDSSSRKKWEEKLLNEEGIINVWQRKDVKEKSKQTLLKNYGVENPSQSSVIIERKRITFNKNGNGVWIPFDQLTEYQIYRNNVWQITNQSIKKYGNDMLINRKKYNENKIYKNKLAIDHKYSVSQGFKNKISPEIVGCIINLQLLTVSENASKNGKCSISLQKLVNDYNNFINENKGNTKN